MTFPLPSRRQVLSGSLALAATRAIPRTFAQENALTATNPKVANGEQGVVATVNPIASRAAIDAFEQGGNAIDAAVAASLMLSVVDGFNSGIGGGCLALVRLASGAVIAIDGREKAPALAGPEMFFRDGKPDPKLSQIGPLAAGVPGLLAALHRLSAQFGSIDWKSSLLGAAQVADSGFAIDSNYASRLASVAGLLRSFPESARVLLSSSGAPLKKGDVLRQPDLARTLRSIAEDGTDWFYKGEFADRVEAMMLAEQGLLRAADFQHYNTVQREPVQMDYRGKRVFGFPPPSSGGIHVAQMLGMLDGFDVQGLFDESEASGRHLLIEVMKRAMADRAYWLGDADFTKVPKGLIDSSYLTQRRSGIDLKSSTSVDSHGQPPRANVDLFGRGGHTTHLTTADSEGNVVALTQTVNTTFGSKMIVPGTGVVLNNELDDFSIAPGVRNAFGLVGSEANLIAPGKRPLSSMSPTIVVDQQNNPLLSCGAAGGPKIITTVLQIIVRVLDLQQSVDQAIASPRTHHQWSPDKTVCERATDSHVIDQLRAFGHDVSTISSGAVAQGISFNESTMTAASDPRVPSAAMSR